MATLEIDVKKRFIGKDPRIIGDPNHFCVIANVLVGRRRCRAASISDDGADDAGKTPEPGVGTPESTEAEDRRREAGILFGLKGLKPHRNQGEGD
jgi:hypothetical protein